MNNLAPEYLSDLIPPTVSETSNNYLRNIQNISQQANRPARAPFLSDETICGICIRYSTIETKETARIGYNGFLFPHEYSGEGRGA